MKTKQEIISFLEGKLGTKIPCVGNPSLDGQCVTLIKSLMEFLGVPEPYKARGNAKDCITKYLSEGIAKPGLGFISVFSNKDMGGGYGHIWCNAGEGDGTFYESNGVKPLTCTKGKTYTYDNVCNFDSYISDDTYRGYDLTNKESMKVCVDQQIKVVEGLLVDKSQYEAVKGQFTELQKQNESLSNELGAVRGELSSSIAKIDTQNKVIASYVNEDAVQLETLKRLERESNEYRDEYFTFLMAVQRSLKLSETIDSTLETQNVAVDALQKLVQANETLQAQVKELQAQVKKLNTQKLPIVKLSQKDLLLELLNRMFKRSTIKV